VNGSESESPRRAGAVTESSGSEYSAITATWKSNHSSSLLTIKRMEIKDSLLGDFDGDVRLLYVEDALEMIPMGLFQYRLLMMCGAAFMADALEVNLLTFLATCAGDEWGLSDTEKAAITSTVFAGIICGTAFWGLFADAHGRKLTFFLAAAMIIIGGFLSGLAPSWYWLIAFRALAGFGIGGASVPFDLLAEFLPASRRGPFLVYIEYFWTAGSLFVAGLAWGTLSSQGWRFLAYMVCIPVTVACAFALVYLPESPRWLLIKGRAEEAEQIIRDAAAVNGFVMPPFRLHHVVETATKDAQYWDLLKDKKVRNVTLPLWLVWLMFGFTYYGVILFVGRLYSTDGDDDGKTCSFNYAPIFINAASEVAGCTAGALVINTWGRRQSQVVFYSIAGVAVFFMGFEHSYLAVLLVGIVGRMGSMAASNATWVTTPEQYTTEMRTVGHASCVAWSKVGAFAAPFVVSSPLPAVLVGILLCGGNLIGALACTTMPETLGVQLDQSEPRMLSADRESRMDWLGRMPELGESDVSGASGASGVSP